MANPLKQLAGQTVIYGLSTILARIINFLFVPIYTRLLTPESYGVVTEFMAYIAVLQVVLVLGLETGCFRFANKEGVDPKKVYSNAFVTVFCISATFLALMVAFAGPISSALGYEGYSSCIMYMGGILALDAVTAILFARLRQEGRALKFAVFKTIKIITETAANLVLFCDVFCSYTHVDVVQCVYQCIVEHVVFCLPCTHLVSRTSVGGNQVRSL
jgi:O-antigen/teichoic acid export membrane protein